MFALTPAADVLALPLSHDLHDALHAAYGTGEWLDAGARISTGDQIFASQASRGSALAYLEIHTFGGVGEQSAALWLDGHTVLKPTTLAADLAARRAPAFWPINVALKGLGIAPAADGDALAVVGLAAFRSNEDLVANAREIV